MRRFFPLAALAAASLMPGTAFPRPAPEMPVPAPYNLVLEGSLPEATVLHVDFGDKEIAPVSLSIVGGQLLGGLSLPGEQGRRIGLHAENADGKTIYEGAAEIDVGREFTPQVAVEMKSEIDGTPGELTIASHRAAVVFAAVERDGKPFTRLTADVFDAGGSRLELKPDDVTWEINDPRIRETLTPCPILSGAPPLCVEFEPLKPDGIQLELDVCLIGRICVIVPVPPVPPVWSMVTAGLGAHACALKLDGRAYCWGRADKGQLGYDAPNHCAIYGSSGTTTSCGLWPQELQCGSAPCQFTDISAGVDHTCAIDRNGKAWCWGDNYDGALGLGYYSDPEASGISAPQPVIDPPMGRYAAIRAGDGSTCALTTTREVYCWGFNGTNLVPQDTHRWLNTPMRVNLAELVDTLDMSNLHACAGTGGKLYCWGRAANGELGTVPFATAMPCRNCPAAPVLMQNQLPMLNGVHVNLVSAGMDGSCAHLGTAETLCWGTPIKDFPGRLPLRRLSRGANHYCAISGSNASPDWLHCAGVHALGDGVASHPFPGVGPVRVAKPVPRFKDVDAGNKFTCAIGIDEEVYCWGEGTYGRLGLGNPDYDMTVPAALRFPVPVQTPNFPLENWKP